jgi:hypothetical protein
MAPGEKRLPKVVGPILTLAGLGCLSFAWWSGNRQYTILKSWPAVEAKVMKSEVVRRRSAARRTENHTTYGVAIIFHYTVDGAAHTTRAPEGRTWSEGGAKRMAAQYASGTRHLVHYNPGDPNDIRFDVGYNFDFFFLPIVFGVTGVVLAGVGGELLYKMSREKSRL